MSRSGRAVLAVLAAAVLSTAREAAAMPDKPALLLADFESPAMETLLGGTIAGWKRDPTDSSQHCDLALESDPLKERNGTVLRIDYDIKSDKTTYQTPTISESGAEDVKLIPSDVGFHSMAYAGAYFGLADVDLRGYRYLAFSVRGDADAGFTRVFKLEMQGGGRTESILFDKVTGEWKRHFVPLVRFSSVVDLEHMNAVVIVFDQNATRQQGRIYIDDIFFSRGRDVDFRPSVPLAMVPKTDSAPLVDGSLDEWSGAAKFELLPSGHLESGQAGDDKDVSAKVMLLWDDERLYFAIHVRDNELVCLKKDSGIHQSDSVELFIDPQGDGLEWDNASDIQLAFSPTCPPPAQSQVWSYFDKRIPTLQEVDYAAQIIKNGYDIESSISWKFLGVQPMRGMRIGFSSAVNDTDIKDGTLRAKLNWFMAKDPRAEQKFGLGWIELAER